MAAPSGPRSLVRAGPGRMDLSGRIDLEQAMVVGALGRAIDLAGLQDLLPARAGRDIFQRSFQPRRAHIAYLAAAVAAGLVDHGRVAQPDMRRAGLRRHVDYVELAPAALGDPLHVVMKHLDAVHAVM